jgi:hypothetical protein
MYATTILPSTSAHEGAVPAESGGFRVADTSLYAKIVIDTAMVKHATIITRRGIYARLSFGAESVTFW